MASALNAQVDAPVIETRGLVKHCGSLHALNGLCLTAHPGEVGGCLGPNGTGESTTIRVLLELVRAAARRVFGRDPWREASALHRRISTIRLRDTRPGA